MPACFDGLVLPGGKAAIDALSQDGRALEYIKDHYRHCKTILALGESTALLEQCGIDPDEADEGIVIAAKPAAGVKAFIRALARHRHPQRETDPPRI